MLGRTETAGELLTIRDLSVQFRTLAGRVQAVDTLSLRIRPGSTVALVGELGSGKSVTAQAIMGILPRTAHITGGEILFNDPGTGPRDLAKLLPRSKDFVAIRGDRIGMIFQEPMTSFSPLHTIGDQIGEALAVHHKVSPEEKRARTIEMLRLVEFPRPEDTVDTYPFELSGGLRQRAMVAMALICRPSLLIADEPTTALDVTVQAQILKLIRDVQSELGMAVLLITHDLGVVANMAEEVVVAHHGKVVEAGTLNDIFSHPTHPYLKALLQAVPHFDMKPGERLKPIREIVTPMERLSGSPLIDRSDGTLLEVRHLSKSFGMRKHMKWLSRGQDPVVMALNDVSFTVERGECLGLVGEFGLRQDNRLQGDHAGSADGRRRDHLPRPRPADRPAEARPQADGAGPAQDSVHLPGPLLLAEPAHDDRRRARRAVRHPRHRHRRDAPCGGGQAA